MKEKTIRWTVICILMLFEKEAVRVTLYCIWLMIIIRILVPGVSSGWPFLIAITRGHLSLSNQLIFLYIHMAPPTHLWSVAPLWIQTACSHQGDHLIINNTKDIRYYYCPCFFSIFLILIHVIWSFFLNHSDLKKKFILFVLERKIFNILSFFFNFPKFWYYNFQIYLIINHTFIILTSKKKIHSHEMFVMGNFVWRIKSDKISFDSQIKS